MPKKVNLIFLPIILPVILIGCSTRPNPSTNPSIHKQPATVTSSQRQAEAETNLKAKLHNQHQDWRGTPYQYGGLSKQGIDCSGFVYLTFAQVLNIKIPRTTYHQSKYGALINQENIQIGDLLFFKTDEKIRHVGIYIGNHRFLHASTKIGVTISRLNNPYWKSRYWKAQRVH